MNERELEIGLSDINRNRYLAHLEAIGENKKLPLAALHELCYKTGRSPVAFRAAWILEHVAVHHPEKFIVVFDAFIRRLAKQRNFSCQRHFTKILMIITSPGAPQDYRLAYARADREQLLTVVFEWLVAPETPVAVQANCMEVLFNMSGEFEWLRDELKLQIEFLLRNGSAAIQSRGKKVLDGLARRG